MEAAEYAEAVAGVGDFTGRDRGVPEERLGEMRAAWRLLQAGDRDAFYVVLNEHATRAAKAVAELVGKRADDEMERATRPATDNEPTNPTIMDIPPEAVR